MFENFISTVKAQTSNITDNLKVKSRKLTYNINSLKNRITNKPKTSVYHTVNQKDDSEYLYSDYLSPRAFYVSDTWPSMNDNMQWEPYVPPKLDEHNIVDRFVKVITINDDDDDDSVRFV